MIKLLKRKKDYRLICKLIYKASPSLWAMGYRAGCNINKHTTPCKRCERCKYGIPPLLNKKFNFPQKVR